MATNLRAYRDGNRLVLVIENPTKDLESIVGALISGEVNPVKDLTEPKPMAKPKVDLSQMQEIHAPEALKPEPETSELQPVPNKEHKKAPFVRKLEEQQAAAKANAEKPVVATQVKPQMQQTRKLEMVEGMQTTAVKPSANATQSVKTSSVSNAASPVTPKPVKPHEVARQQVSTVKPVNAQVKQQVQASVEKQPEQVATKASNERTELVKKVWSMRSNAKVKALLKAKYQDENYDIRRLSTAQLVYLSKL